MVVVPLLPKCDNNGDKKKKNEVGNRYTKIDRCGAVFQDSVSTVSVGCCWPLGTRGFGLSLEGMMIRAGGGCLLRNRNKKTEENVGSNR